MSQQPTSWSLLTKPTSGTGCVSTQDNSNPIDPPVSPNKTFTDAASSPICLDVQEHSHASNKIANGTSTHTDSMADVYQPCTCGSHAANLPSDTLITYSTMLPGASNGCNNTLPTADNITHIVSYCKPTPSDGRILAADTDYGPVIAYQGDTVELPYSDSRINDFQHSAIVSNQVDLATQSHYANPNIMCGYDNGPDMPYCEIDVVTTDEADLPATCTEYTAEDNIHRTDGDVGIHGGGASETNKDNTLTMPHTVTPLNMLNNTVTTTARNSVTRGACPVMHCATDYLEPCSARQLNLEKPAAYITDDEDAFDIPSPDEPHQTHQNCTMESQYERCSTESNHKGYATAESPVHPQRGDVCSSLSFSDILAAADTIAVFGDFNDEKEARREHLSPAGVGSADDDEQLRGEKRGDHICFTSNYDPADRSTPDERPHALGTVPGQFINVHVSTPSHSEVPCRSDFEITCGDSHNNDDIPSLSRRYHAPVTPSLADMQTFSRGHFRDSPADEISSDVPRRSNLPHERQTVQPDERSSHRQTDNPESPHSCVEVLEFPMSSPAENDEGSVAESLASKQEGHARTTQRCQQRMNNNANIRHSDLRFALKLWAMLHNYPSGGAVSWHPDGTSVLLHESRFSESATLMYPGVVRSERVVSFKRRLNAAGFRRVLPCSTSERYKQARKTATTSRFAHAYFRRGRPDLLGYFMMWEGSNTGMSTQVCGTDSAASPLVVDAAIVSSPVTGGTSYTDFRRKAVRRAIQTCAKYKLRHTRNQTRAHSLHRARSQQSKKVNKKPFRLRRDEVDEEYTPPRGYQKPITRQFGRHPAAKMNQRSRLGKIKRAQDDGRNNSSKKAKIGGEKHPLRGSQEESECCCKCHEKTERTLTHRPPTARMKDGWLKGCVMVPFVLTSCGYLPLRPYGSRKRKVSTNATVTRKKSKKSKESQAKKESDDGPDVDLSCSLTDHKDMWNVATLAIHHMPQQQ